MTNWKLYFQNYETDYPCLINKIKPDYIDGKNFSESWDLAFDYIQNVKYKYSKYSNNKIREYLSFDIQQINSENNKIILTKYCKPLTEPKEDQMVVIGACSDRGLKYFLFKGENYFNQDNNIQYKNLIYYENISIWLIESNDFSLIFNLFNNTHLYVDSILKNNNKFYLVVSTKEIDENVKKFFNIFNFKYFSFNEIKWIKESFYIWKKNDETNINFQDLKTRKEGEYYDENGKFLKDRKITENNLYKFKISLSEKFMEKDNCKVEYLNKSKKNKLSLTYFNCFVNDNDEINLEYRFIFNIENLNINHHKYNLYNKEEFFEIYNKNRKIYKCDFQIEIDDYNQITTKIDIDYESSKSGRKKFQKLIKEFIRKYEKR